MCGVASITSTRLKTLNRQSQMLARNKVHQKISCANPHLQPIGAKVVHALDIHLHFALMCAPQTVQRADSGKLYSPIYIFPTQLGVSTMCH